MKEDEPNDEHALRALLREWRALDAPVSLDARVLATYRRRVARPWWRRVLTMRLRVPLPVAAAAVLWLCVTAWLAARHATSLTFATQPLAAPVKFVEVPVVQTKLVTRVVYVAAPAAKPARRKPTPAKPAWAGFRPVNQIKLEIDEGGQ